MKTFSIINGHVPLEILNHIKLKEKQNKVAFPPFLQIFFHYYKSYPLPTSNIVLSRILHKTPNCYIIQQPLSVINCCMEKQTYAETVSTWLLENTTNSGDMFNGKSEHDKVHGCFTHQIVFLKIMLHSLEENIQIEILNMSCNSADHQKDIDKINFIAFMT